MIRNYFTIARRNLVRNRTFSIINIAGLAIGLCCFLLIALYVVDELSYDRFNEKASRIYRIHTEARMGGRSMLMPETPDPMGALLKKDYPQVEEYTRVYIQNGDRLVKKGNEFITETQAVNVDSTFFNIFTLPAVDGNTATALNEPNTVVITESTARKYFNATHVTGRTLEVQERGKTIPYKITAVIRDMPENAHFRFDLLFSMDNVDYAWGQIGNHNFYTYLLLKEHTDGRSLESRFPQYIEKYLFPEIKERMHVATMADFNKAGNRAAYSLMPLTKIHLYSHMLGELRPAGSIQYVYIFSAVALFILLIACVNFMNLTTARSAGRAREVGIRKVLGTMRNELVFQFLTESTLIVALSLLVAIGLAALALPVFNTLAGKSIRLSALFSPLILPLLIVLPFAIGFLSGSYPAFFLSAFRPVEVLKGRLRLGGRTGGLRNALVIFQFATSIVLIIGTIVVYRQLNYIQHRNIGFNKEQVLIVNGTGALGNGVDVLRSKVSRLSGVSSGTVSSFLPVSGSARSNSVISNEAVVNAKSSINLQTWYIDYDYIKTFGMQMAAGRNFSPGYGSDSSAVIINETAARLLGYNDAVGKKIYKWNGASTIASNIIGVVKDFNYESLRQDVGPLCFFLSRSIDFAAFKINTAHLDQLIAQVKDQWEAVAPDVPFSYRFLDDSFNAMYQSEQQVGKIALIFSILAVSIACLGIFGLAAFIAEQRMKEIGIRKVMGASVQGIVRLLSADFLKLVGLAFVIAAPFGWWVMNKWLQDFAYRVSISWWVFLLAGASAMLIALLTVSFQAVKAALMNPLKSLRME